MDPTPQLARALAGGRARSAPPPTPERLAELRRAVAEGRYRVPAERVADSLVAALSSDRRARPG